MYPKTRTADGIHLLHVFVAHLFHSVESETLPKEKTIPKKEAVIVGVLQIGFYQP